LLYVVTAAVRAGGLFRVMFCDGQSLRECFFAGVADELIVGHTDLPIAWLDSSPVAGAGTTITVCPHSIPRTLLALWRRRLRRFFAITFRVLNMKASVQFYQNALGMELLYGGELASFSSLRANDSESAILHLKRGVAVGRLTFHVTDVDAFLTNLREKGLGHRNLITPH